MAEDHIGRRGPGSKETACLNRGRPWISFRKRIDVCRCLPEAGRQATSPRGDQLRIDGAINGARNEADGSVAEHEVGPPGMGDVGKGE